MAEVAAGSPQPDRSLSIAPHIGVRESSARAIWIVALALVPATAWGIALFGLPAVLLIVTTVGASVVVELACTLPFGRFTLIDGSAVLTGLLIALLMPAGAPLYVPVAAASFAILVVKHSFGGLGRNWMNPAIGGALFALLSWGDAMRAWVPALGNASATTPPLLALRQALSGGAQPGGALLVLSRAGYAFSAVDASIVGWVNAHVLSLVGISIPPGTFDVLVGHVPGALGGISAPLLILGGAALIARRVVRWELPVAYLATFALLAAVFGGLANGRGLLSGAPVFHLFSGSLMLGAFFLAADPVTSPLTSRGRKLYGMGLGALTFLLRYFGSLGDGVILSIALGNGFVPFLDRMTRPRVPAMLRKGNR
jgi:Na+-translocating ferredoxin:NAD+ oxidoreductase subunit D